jgi:hypothetical protein
VGVGTSRLCRAQEKKLDPSGAYLAIQSIDACPCAACLCWQRRHTRGSTWRTWVDLHLIRTSQVLNALHPCLSGPQAARTCPLLRWYYMGFYIHSCPRSESQADTILFLRLHATACSTASHFLPSGHPRIMEF